MKVILGLGNPGDKYDGTRHNIGFYLLNSFAKEQSLTWLAKPKFKAIVAEFSEGDEKILLVKPQTFYNMAGETAQAIKDFYKLSNQDILVIHDELDLPFGTLRTRWGGSDAGNNGIKSLVQHSGEDFARIRVGIANEHRSMRPAEVFVLEKFNKDESGGLNALAEHTKNFILDFIHEDREFAHTSVKA